MIHLGGISKMYNTNGLAVHALREVDLTIAEGEFSAIMGPSGSGKSTLLSIIGAMTPPSTGTLTIDGIDVYALDIEKQASFRHEYIGFVFQQLQLLPYLTALENVLLGLVIAKTRRAEKRDRAREVLAKVGLEGKEDRLPHQLSGGEQGRVAVARAIVNRPPVLLADEPTGNLDQATGEQILALLGDLNNEGHTVLMVTHDAQAANHAMSMVRILDGRILAHGTHVLQTDSAVQ